MAHAGLHACVVPPPPPPPRPPLAGRPPPPPPTPQEKRKEQRLRKKAQGLSVRELLDIAYLKGIHSERALDEDTSGGAASSQKASGSKDRMSRSQCQDEDDEAVPTKAASSVMEESPHSEGADAATK